MGNYDQIKNDIQSRKFASIYLLMGDEPYFIDEITDLLCNTVLPEDERDFNQHILYGADTNVSSIITLARNFPMMSGKQLVIIKEAQSLSKIEDLSIYVRTPLESTILVINYKNGFIDKRKKIFGDIQNCGVVLESKKIPDYKLPSFITSFVQMKGIAIDQKSSQLLSDYLGNDLSKISNELDKLLIILPGTQKKITPEIIEKNIGISKDYNNFELLKAVVVKDNFKAMQIADYFEKNPKKNPLFITLSVLFNFFSNLMICYWAKDKSEQGLATELGLKSPFLGKDYALAIKGYNAYKTMDIISLLRIYDAKSKGVDNISVSDGQLLKELLCKIIN